MTLWKNDERGNIFYKTCAEIMKTDPSRASLVMWKSAWETGIYLTFYQNNGAYVMGNEGLGKK